MGVWRLSGGKPRGRLNAPVRGALLAPAEGAAARARFSAADGAWAEAAAAAEVAVAARGPWRTTLTVVPEVAAAPPVGRVVLALPPVSEGPARMPLQRRRAGAATAWPAPPCERGRAAGAPQA